MRVHLLIRPSPSIQTSIIGRLLSIKVRTFLAFRIGSIGPNGPYHCHWTSTSKRAANKPTITQTVQPQSQHSASNKQRHHANKKQWGRLNCHDDLSKFQIIFGEAIKWQFIIWLMPNFACHHYLSESKTATKPNCPPHYGPIHSLQYVRTNGRP